MCSCLLLDFWLQSLKFHNIDSTFAHILCHIYSSTKCKWCHCIIGLGGFMALLWLYTRKWNDICPQRVKTRLWFYFYFLDNNEVKQVHNKREAFTAVTTGCWIGSCPSVFSQLFGIKLKFDGGTTPEDGSRRPAPWWHLGKTGSDSPSEDGTPGKLWCGKVQSGAAIRQEWV